MPQANPHPVLLQTTADGRRWDDILAFITGGYYIDADHWLVGPDVVKSPIPEASTQPVIHPWSAILHSNAGPKSSGWRALWLWVRNLSVNGEPHFQNAYDAIAQYMPLNRRADCNAKANSWKRNGKVVGAVSFETQDNGAATLAETPWTFDQVRRMVATLTCTSVVYGVWCTAPVSWDDSGIGYHSQFKEWSIYVGKTCPGAARIRQMDHIRAEVQKNLAAFIENTGWACGTGKP